MHLCFDHFSYRLVPKLILILYVQMPMTTATIVHLIETVMTATPPRLSVTSELIHLLSQIRGDDILLIEACRAAKKRFDSMPDIDPYYLNKRLIKARHQWRETGGLNNPHIREILPLMQNSLTVNREMNHAYKERVNTNMASPVVINGNQMALLWQVAAHSDIKYQKVFALMLSTGSRLCEIIGADSGLATFAAVEGQPTYVHISDIAKQTNKRRRFRTYGDNSVKPAIAVTRPMLFGDYEWFSKTLSEVRLNCSKNGSNTSQGINHECRRLLPQAIIANPLNQSITGNFLRKIYIMMVWQLLYPKEPEHVVARRILGHQSDENILTYHTIRVEFPDDTEDSDYEFKVKYMEELDNARRSK